MTGPEGFALVFAAAHWTRHYSGAGGTSSFSGDATAGDDALALAVSAGMVGNAIARGRIAPGYAGGDYWTPDGCGDVAFRVDFTSGNTDADGAALVGLGGPLASDPWVALRCGADGALRIVDSTGADVTMDVAGPDSTARTSGNLWLRATANPLGFVGWWGVGYDADSMPREWTACAVGTTAETITRSRGGAPIVGASATGGGVSGGLAVAVTCSALWSPSVEAWAAAGGRNARRYAIGDGPPVSPRFRIKSA